MIKTAAAGKLTITEELVTGIIKSQQKSGMEIKYTVLDMINLDGLYRKLSTYHNPLMHRNPKRKFMLQEQIIEQSRIS